MGERDLTHQLPEEFSQPDYTGDTIANVPATAAALMDVPFAGLPPLAADKWQPLAGRVKRVILFVIDAWGWNLLHKDREALGGWVERADIVGQITSIFPSTTVAALSSLWTGYGPAQHGLVGLELFMPDYGTITQFLKFTPAFGSYPDALVDAGLKPEAFLDVPGFAKQLAQSGVETHAFKGREIIDSALSKMHGRGVTGNYGAVTVTDMCIQMRQVLEEKAGRPLFMSGYWPSVDTLSHIYGWDHEIVAAEARVIWQQLMTELMDKLSPAARRDTAVFVLADHGQVVTPPAQRVLFSDHPELERMMFMRPAGEPRTVYLYARHGRTQDIIHYINENLRQAMTAVAAQDALAAGWLGPSPHAPAAVDRVGDVIVTMRDGYVLLTEKERKWADKMKGRHGGMTHAEMQVPWLGFHLEGW